jgi:hypothetical protein
MSAKCRCFGTSLMAHDVFAVQIGANFDIFAASYFDSRLAIEMQDLGTEDASTLPN